MSHITVSGLIATTPRHLVTQEGLPITSFRLASTSDRFDANGNMTGDSNTNWYTITAFHSLALNASTCLNKGDRIVVSGLLRVRDWDNGERAGTSVEIEANAIGHDLAWGKSTFERTVLVQTETPEPEQTNINGHACNCRRCGVRTNG